MASQQVINQASGDGWQMFHGDCCQVLRGIPDRSIDFTIHSPPFSSLFVYSASEADMGNCQSHEEFIRHYRYCIEELYRVTAYGRCVAVHCTDLPKFAYKDDTIGLWDFPGMIIRAFVSDEAADFAQSILWLERRKRAAMLAGDEYRAQEIDYTIETLNEELKNHPSDSGFEYHSRVTVWKCPVVERERTNAVGLLHKTIERDRSQVRQGLPDYLLVFRKPPKCDLLSEKPISGNGLTSYVGMQEFDPRKNKFHPSPYARKKPASRQSIDLWQRYADPVWWDVDQQNTLNVRVARDDKDERHICPLQLDLIERSIDLWSAPGDVVLSPFAGIGSEGVGAIRRGRKFVGVELKEKYFDHACKNLTREVEIAKQKQMDLFTDTEDSNADTGMGLEVEVSSSDA